MIAGWKSIAVTALLAALVSGAGAWLGAGWVTQQRATPSLHDIVHHDLDLTPDQAARLKVIEDRFATTRPALEEDVRAANRELAAAIAANQGDSPQVQAAVDHFHDAMGALQKATIAHVFEMRAVLTPEQTRAFDRCISDALLQETR